MIIITALLTIISIICLFHMFYVRISLCFYDQKKKLRQLAANCLSGIWIFAKQISFWFQDLFLAFHFPFTVLDKQSGPCNELTHTNKHRFNHAHLHDSTRLMSWAGCIGPHAIYFDKKLFRCLFLTSALLHNFYCTVRVQ